MVKDLFGVFREGNSIGSFESFFCTFLFSFFFSPILFRTPRIGKEVNTISKSTKQSSISFAWTRRMQVCQTNQVSKKMVKNLCRWLKIFVGLFREGNSIGSFGSFFSTFFFSSFFSSISLEKKWIQFRNPGNFEDEFGVDATNAGPIIGTNRISKMVVKKIKDVCRNFSRRKLD